MPSLTVREIPENVLKRLRQAAREHRRSLNAQVITWLEDAAGRWKSQRERDRLFEQITKNREATYRRHGMGSDSAELIRQMRDERAQAGK